MRRNTADTETLNYRGWINADGPPTSGTTNVITQITELNSKLATLNDRKGNLTAGIKALERKISDVASQSCSKDGRKYRGWYDGSGVYWCAADSEAGYVSAVNQIAVDKAEIAGIDAKLKPLIDQLDQLNKVLPEAAKADPAVIKANIEAEKTKAASSDKSKIVGLIVGGILLLVVGYVTVKIMRKGK